MGSEDTYVYLRVFSDRTAECQSSKHINAEKKELSAVKKTLTSDNIKGCPSFGVGFECLAQLFQKGTPS
jgi:hypothetical protein